VSENSPVKNQTEMHIQKLFPDSFWQQTELSKCHLLCLPRWCHREPSEVVKGNSNYVYPYDLIASLWCILQHFLTATNSNLNETNK